MRAGEKIKALLHRSIRALGYEVTGIRYTPRQMLIKTHLRQLEFDDVICRQMVESGGSLSFLQIGSCDGVTADPLHKYIERYQWRGLLVEPHPLSAARLRKLYGGNDLVKIVEAAVDAAAGKRELFSVNSAGLPEWAIGLSSFDREVVLRHETAIPNLTNLIRSDSVECITFSELLSGFATDNLDLLQVDTEGFDAKLLSLFPFHQLRPAIVHWEIKHLSKTEREESLQRLLSFGYKIAASGGENMIAVRL